MIGRTFLTLVNHGAAAISAFVLLGFLHHLSDRKIWAILGDTSYVRQLSVYILNVLPIYIITLLIFSAVFCRLRRRAEIQPFSFILLSFVAGGASILFHLALFPTNPRAAVFFLVFVALYGGNYILLGQIGPARWLDSVRWRPLPSVSGLWVGAVLVFAVFMTYVSVFTFGFSGLQEQETYRRNLEPSAPENWFRPSAGPMPEAPLTNLFEAEELQFEAANSVQVVDINRDGYYDILALTQETGIQLWLNQHGNLKNFGRLLPQMGNHGIGNFSLADYNRDGKPDILVADTGLVKESGFENSFLKQIYWYPTEKPASVGRLFRQISLDRWEEVTTKAFPIETPKMFRKLEPITWFDANGDGLLDIIWSGYPHPRRTMNRLYIQKPDATFANAISTLLDWTEGGTYPEGSDAGDMDGDGDIDLFAYGYLFRNDDGNFTQLCGADFPEIVCGSSGRLDEGGLIEDITGDGVMDFVLSYHGGHGPLPKYYLQLFRGTPGGGKPLAIFQREKSAGEKYYGFNTYMRAKDFDFNGVPDLLTTVAGRLLTWYRGDWVDLLPEITGAPSGAYKPFGWIDIDEDGDWDFIARRLSDGKRILFRNRLNPDRYMKISVLGAGGIENQDGATIKLKLPGGRALVKSYRHHGGYSGYTDPRLIIPFQPDQTYQFNVCFRTLPDAPPVAALPIEGIGLRVVGVRRNCVNYELALPPEVRRLDIRFMADKIGAKISVNGI